MILCRTFAIANERVCRHYINKASPSASQTHQPTTAQRSVKADATRRNKIQAVLVRLGYSSIITNNRECPSSNGVPALRFQCSAEDRITKEVCALKSYFTRSCHHRCQHSLFYIPTVPDFTGYPTTQDLHFPHISHLIMMKLTPMQEETATLIGRKQSVLLLSPTGSGKTLAFLLPIMRLIEAGCETPSPTAARGPVAVVVAPSRELALQMEQTLKEQNMGRSLKIAGMALYGGRPTMEEHRTLKSIHPPIIFATPGRLLDHIDKGNIETAATRILVVDEYDKCLELGFREEMDRIAQAFRRCPQIVLTSATRSADIGQAADECPTILRGKTFATIDYLENNAELRSRIEIVEVPSPEKDKLHTLGQLLTEAGGKSCIVFVAHRESAERVGKYLKELHFDAIVYHGGMEQDRRERALGKFRAGAANVMVSTDLAARGLDIPDVERIIHYHLPLDEATFTHRSGRTARWEASGESCLIVGPEETLPAFIQTDRLLNVSHLDIHPTPSAWTLIYIGRGKKDKLSRADVAGFFCKKGGLNAPQIGRIILTDHATFAAVQRKAVRQLLKNVAGEKIKGMKTIIEEIRK